jgi:hypothetical protein
MRDLLLSSVRAAELAGPCKRPSPAVVAGLLLEAHGEIEALAHAEEQVRYLRACVVESRGPMPVHLHIVEDKQVGELLQLVRPKGGA